MHKYTSLKSFTTFVWATRWQRRSCWLYYQHTKKKINDQNGTSFYCLSRVIPIVSYYAVVDLLKPSHSTAVSRSIPFEWLKWYCTYYMLKDLVTYIYSFCSNIHNTILCCLLCKYHWNWFLIVLKIFLGGTLQDMIHIYVYVCSACICTKQINQFVICSCFIV